VGFGIGPREWVLLGANLGRAIVTNGGLYSVRMRQRRDAALFPNYFGQTSFHYIKSTFCCSTPRSQFGRLVNAECVPKEFAQIRSSRTDDARPRAGEAEVEITELVGGFNVAFLIEIRITTLVTRQTACTPNAACSRPIKSDLTTAVQIRIPLQSIEDCDRHRRERSASKLSLAYDKPDNKLATELETHLISAVTDTICIELMQRAMNYNIQAQAEQLQQIV